MAGNCDATNGAGLSNAPTPGWDSSADCSSVMNICSPPTGPSSISPASGSRYGNVYETRCWKMRISINTFYSDWNSMYNSLQVEVTKTIFALEILRVSPPSAPPMSSRSGTVSSYKIAES